MPRGVGYDELALFSSKKTIGDVDGDALFALCCEAVDEEGKVNLAALGAYTFAVCFKRSKLIFKDHLAVIEQASNQRGFTIVNRATGDETQHGFVLVRLKIGINVFGNKRVCFINRFGRHSGAPLGCEMC